MTIAESTINELDVGQIITLAYRRAGLLNVYASLDTTRRKAGAEELGVVLDSLQARSVLSRVKDTVTLQLVRDVGEVAVPANVLEVINSAQYVPEDEDPLEPLTNSPVALVSQGVYNESNLRGQSGIPHCMYVDRAGSGLVLRLYPKPADNGYLRVQVQKLLAAVNDATKTVQVERPWSNYLINALAAQLGRTNSLSLARIADLEAAAERAYRDVAGFNATRAPTQVVPRIGTPWRR